MSLERKGSAYINDMLEYNGELMDKSDISTLSIKDILGFEPPKGFNAFSPSIHCIPIRTLLPLYDTLIVGIPKIEKISQFRDKTGLTFKDIVTLTHKEKLIPFINVDCTQCLRDMSSVVQHLVENDVPLIFAGPQENLLELKAAENLGIDTKLGEEIHTEYSRMIESPETRKMQQKINVLVTRLRRKGELRDGVETRLMETTYPASICSKIKPTAEYLKEVIDVGRKGAPPEYLKALVGQLYMIPSFLLSKGLNSTLATNATCRHLYRTEEDLKKMLPMLKAPNYFDPDKLEFIEKRLHIAFSEGIPLVEYAEIFDSKTTRAVRKIIKTIISGTISKDTSYIALQNAINEYNQQVKQLVSRKTKRASMVYATSDILRSNAEAIKMLMGGISEKFLGAPKKAWGCIVLPKRYRRRVSNWLKHKTVGIESRLMGVSPDIIHLYHTRTCLEKLKGIPRSS